MGVECEHLVGGVDKKGWRFLLPWLFLTKLLVGVGLGPCFFSSMGQFLAVRMPGALQFCQCREVKQE